MHFSQTMNMRLYTAFSVLALTGTLVSGADKPDITGTWQLDVAKSNFGDKTTPSSMTLTVSQEKKMIRISQTSTTPNDERTVETECRTDGRFHPVQGPVGGSVRCKWEGATLISEKELSDGHSKLEMRLTVSPDRATATEQLHITNTSGAGDNTLVWKRM